MSEKLVPELRFPEFKSDGEWKEKKLGKLGVFLGGGTPDRANDDFWKGDIPWISSSDIRENDIHNISITRFINEKSVKLSATKLIPKGSVLFVSRVGVGKLAINKHDLCTSQDFTNFVPKKNVFNLFIGYYFSSNKNILQSLNQGTSIKGFSKGDLENLKLPYTKSEDEAQKIASCLSSIDEIIAAHIQKLNLLKDHKKSLIQNLFPQEGEKVPNFRFPEFENEAKWRKTTIDQIAKVSAGGTPDSTNSEYWNGNIPWMNSGELNNKRIYSVSNYITSKGLKESSTKLIPPYCVLIGLAGQGKTRGTAAINYIELCTNQSIGSIHPNEDVFDSEFIYQKVDSMYEKLRYLSAGDGGRGGLNLQIIKGLELLLPNIKEQKKIASCLSALDELIKAQAEKIEELKRHKKGLMQGLFPKMND